MTITTFDGVLAGVQPTQYFHFFNANISSANRLFSLWGSGGNMANGAYDISTAGGVTLSSSSGVLGGQIPHYDPASGSAYIARLVVKTGSGGSIGGSIPLLVDRLWHCGATNTGTQLSVTSTAVQNVASVAWPARDDNGKANGVGVFIGVEVLTTLGAGVPTYTITGYAPDGSALSGAINVSTTIATAGLGTFYGLRTSANSGQSGVANVTTYSQSVSSTSGSIVLVAYRPLMFVSPITAGASATGDLIIGGFPKLANGVVPFLLEYTFSAVARSVYGTYTETQG